MAQTTITDHPESDQPSSNDAESLQTFDEIEQDAHDSTTTEGTDAEEPQPKPRRRKTGGRAKGSRNRKNAAPPAIVAPEPEPEENEDPEPAQEPEEDDDPEHLLALKSDLFYWLDNLNDETWSRLMVYCYRKEPVWLQDKTGGKPHYIQKMSQRFSADDLKRTQGSGIYRIDVTLALERGGSKRLKTGDVHILDPMYPPNLPVSDAWTKNPINSKWFWAIPILEARERQAASMGQAPRSATQTAAINTLPPSTSDDEGLVGLAKRSQEQLMALSDPTRQLDTVQKIIEMMKPTTPPPDTANSPMMLMFNMMMEQNREMREEVRQMRTQQSAPPPTKDAKSVILETLELAEALGLRRGGKPERTDPWANFLEKVIDNAPVIADLIISTRQPQQQPQAQPQQQQSIPLPPSRPQPEPEEEDEEEDETMSSTAKQQEIMQALEPIIRNSVGPMIEAVRAQKPLDLRRWFLDEYGRTNFEALKMHIGAERMAEMATTHPVLKIQLPNKAIMQKFFDEVFA